LIAIIIPKELVKLNGKSIFSKLELTTDSPLKYIAVLLHSIGTLLAAGAVAGTGAGGGGGIVGGACSDTGAGAFTYTEVVGLALATGDGCWAVKLVGCKLVNCNRNC